MTTTIPGEIDIGPIRGHCNTCREPLNARVYLRPSVPKPMTLKIDAVAECRRCKHGRAYAAVEVSEASLMLAVDRTAQIQHYVALVVRELEAEACKSNKAASTSTISEVLTSHGPLTITIEDPTGKRVVLHKAFVKSYRQDLTTGSGYMDTELVIRAAEVVGVPSMEYIPIPTSITNVQDALQAMEPGTWQPPAKVEPEKPKRDETLDKRKEEAEW